MAPKKSAPKMPVPKILEDPGVNAIATISDSLPKASPKTQHPIVKAPASSAQLRAQIGSYWRWGIANEPQIHYSMERPMERLNNKKALQTLPRNADCSEFFTDGYAFAGAPDPNGEHYNGTGFTGTLISHGIQIPKGEAQLGDAVIFGTGVGHHVCGLLLPGDDPLLMSHGQEKGPVAIRLSVEAAYQPGPVRFFRYLSHS